MTCTGITVKGGNINSGNGLSWFQLCKHPAKWIVTDKENSFEVCGYHVRRYQQMIDHDARMVKLLGRAPNPLYTVDKLLEPV